MIKSIFNFLAIIAVCLLFASCGDDSDGVPSISDIQGNFEGEWFLVKHICSDSEDGTETEVWDDNNMYEYGTEGSNPRKLSVEKYDDGFEIDEYYYSGYRWNLVESDWYELDSNIIERWDEPGDGEGCVYIEKLTETELVIVEEDSYYEDGINYWHKDTYTYVRIVD